MGIRSTFFKKWAIPGLFFFTLVLSLLLTETNVLYKSLPMTGFKLQISGVRSYLSTN